MEGKITFFELGVDDVERGRAFYEGLFGWTFEPGPSGQGFMIRTPNAPGGMHGGDPGATPYVFFEVSDMDEAMDRVRKLGGTVDDTDVEGSEESIQTVRSVQALPRRPRAPRSACMNLRRVADRLGAAAAVRAGDDLQIVPVRVVEVGAAAAVMVVDLARLLMMRIRVVRDSGLLDAPEDRVEVLFGHQERVVLGGDAARSRSSMKSSVTPLTVLTGRNGPYWGPTSKPRIVARNSAEALMSRAATIVWLSSTGMCVPPQVESLARRRRSACSWSTRKRTSRCSSVSDASASGRCTSFGRLPSRSYETLIGPIVFTRLPSMS